MTWRTGDTYCGWAPLPPGAYLDGTGGFLFHGKHVDVHFTFGLNWHHFNFCAFRDLSDHRRFAPRREKESRIMFDRSTVIHNYGVKKVVVDDQPRIQIINRGIDPDRVKGKGRPIEVVKIHDLHTPPPNRIHERFDPRKKTMEVYRPRVGEPFRH